MRLFRCRDCGHKMRLRKAHCGRCYTEKATFQRLSTYVWLAIGVAFVTVFAATR